jgi:dTDP-4-amino-4,6-dideoxygalactose transaminase
VLQASEPQEIATLRRRNYETLCRLLADLPGVTLFKPQLEPGMVPYMVPLRVPGLRRLFADLENRAFPMQRFGQFLSPDLDASLCPVSSDLSHHGLQLPCHQSMLPEEIEWMVEQLRDACRSTGRA